MPEDNMSNATQGSEADSMANASSVFDTPPSNGGADTQAVTPKPPDSNENLVLAKQLSDKERYIREQKAQIQELSAMVNELNGKYEALTQTLRKPQEDTSFEDEVYTDLPKTLKSIQTNLEKKFEEKLSAKEKELWGAIEARDDNMKMWNSFYEENKHLQPLRWRVIPALVDNLQRTGRLNGLSKEDKLDLVAKEANKEYLNLKRSLGVGESQNSNPAPNMRTSHSSGPGKQDNLPKDPATLKELSDEIIKSHREAVSRIK